MGWDDPKRCYKRIFLSVCLPGCPYLSISNPSLSTSIGFYLSLSLSYYLSHFSIYLCHLCLSMSIYVYLCLSICIYLYLSLSASTRTYLYLSIHLSIYFSTYLLYLSISIYLSIFLSFFLSVYLPVFLSIYVSLSVCVKYLHLSLLRCLSIYLCPFSSICIYLSSSTSLIFYLSLSISFLLYFYLSMCTYLYLSLSMSSYLSYLSFPYPCLRHFRILIQILSRVLLLLFPALFISVGTYDVDTKPRRKDTYSSDSSLTPQGNDVTRACCHTFCGKEKC